MIEAGADIFVMPSRYEPCGLNQIYSLKYGTIPIVRKTGGLADTVKLYNWKTKEGTGFVFEDYSSRGLSWALNYAIDTYQHRTSWKKLMHNAMKLNFSWEKQVKKYIQLYDDVAGRRVSRKKRIKSKK
jgi:starch synthase